MISLQQLCKIVFLLSSVLILDDNNLDEIIIASLQIILQQNASDNLKPWLKCKNSNIISCYKFNEKFICFRKKCLKIKIFKLIKISKIIFLGETLSDAKFND